MKNKYLIILGSVFALILFFMVGAKMYQTQQAIQKTDAVGQNSEVFEREYSPRLGRSGAPVLIVEFLDPECESCRQFYPYVKMLMKDFEGKVQLIVKYAPFHGNSRYAISILEAARKQNRYWEALEVMFQHQPEWGSHHNPRPELIWNYIKDIPGINLEQMQVDMKDPKINEMIEQEIQDGMKLGVRATPTFFINGKELEEFSYEGLKAAIEQGLK